MRISDWSSDVCSSDLGTPILDRPGGGEVRDAGTSDIGIDSATRQSAEGPEGTDPVESGAIETHHDEQPLPVVRPTFRDRLTKARSTFSGSLGSLLSRTDKIGRASCRERVCHEV